MLPEGGAGEKPLSVGNGLPKDVPPPTPQSRLRGAGQDVGPWGAGQDPKWG